MSTHLDAPAHFLSRGKFIGDMPIEWLVGKACVVDLERLGLDDYDVYGPEHFEQWEHDTGITIERGDILVIHTGYHRYTRRTGRTGARPTKRATSSATPARAAHSPSGCSSGESAGSPSTPALPTTR